MDVHTTSITQEGQEEAGETSSTIGDPMLLCTAGIQVCSVLAPPLFERDLLAKGTTLR